MYFNFSVDELVHRVWQCQYMCPIIPTEKINNLKKIVFFLVIIINNLYGTP